VPEFEPTAEQIARAEEFSRRYEDPDFKRAEGVAAGYNPKVKHLLADEMLCGPEHNMMLVGGSRSGKTFTITKAICYRAIKCTGARQFILRHHLKDVAESIGMDTLPKVMKLRFPDVRYKHQKGAGFVRIIDKTFPKEDHSEIWLAGLDDQDRTDKILGKEGCALYFNECSQISYGSVITGISRLAQKLPGLMNRVYYDLNPVGTGHFSYSLFIEGRKPGQLEGLRNPTDYVYMYMNPLDNAANVADGYIQMLMDFPDIKRRRFFDGRYVAQLEGALWTLESIELLRLRPGDPLIPQFQRIVVAVDPSGASGENDLRADEIGIIVAGIGADGHVYILEDLTGLYSPEGWGRAAVLAYLKWQGDCIVAEDNFGGDMVRAVIQGVRIDDKPVGQNVPVKKVTASRGKSVRAEPIAAMNERGMIHHVGDFALLERELINFTTMGYKGSGSPNRADAMVWGATFLFGKTLAYGLTVYLANKQAEITADMESKIRKAAENLGAKVAVGSDMAKVDTTPADGKQPTKGCPECDAVCISAMPGGGKRCASCGHQWDSPGAVPMKPQNRANLVK
jgi:phage terminase large subunit-like protein